MSELSLVRNPVSGGDWVLVAEASKEFETDSTDSYNNVWADFSNLSLLPYCELIIVLEVDVNVTTPFSGRRLYVEAMKYNDSRYVTIGNKAMPKTSPGIYSASVKTTYKQKAVRTSESSFEYSIGFADVYYEGVFLGIETYGQHTVKAGSYIRAKLYGKPFEI